MTDASEQQWSRIAGWTHRIVDDEVLLCNADRVIVSVTGGATPVYAVLDAPASMSEIGARIATTWPDRPLGPAAVAEALEALASHGAVGVVSPEPATATEPGPTTGVTTQGSVAPHRCWGLTDDGSVMEIVVAAHLADELSLRWPPVGLRQVVEEPAAGTPTIGRLGLGEHRLFVPDDLSELAHHPDEVAWGLLEQSLAAKAAEHLDHLVAVHSAVIAWEGAVILVPATSGAGKSSLALAAHEAGAAVLSDEYALIDPESGLVTGWNRPARIRRPGSPGSSGKDRVDIAVDSPPLPVGLVASLTYEPGASTDWTEMSSSESVLALLANTVVARTRPDSSLDAALAVARSADGVVGRRGEAGVSVARLLALVEDRLARGRPAP
ncbi:MAG: hypothetical protein GX643_17760 [Acidimicrobiales bacterium]|nr:hypothetical protein [Acidimicrobiales bacterium]